MYQNFYLFELFAIVRAVAVYLIYNSIPFFFKYSLTNFSSSGLDALIAGVVGALFHGLGAAIKTTEPMVAADN